MVVQLVSNQELIKGLVYLTHTGKFQECLRHGAFVLTTIQESNDVEDEITVLANLVEACLQVSDSEQLKIYFLQYEEKIQHSTNQRSRLDYLILKGHVQLTMLNDEEAAMYYYKKAASFAYQIQEYGSLTIMLTNIIYLHKDKLPLNQLLKLAELSYIFAHQASDRKAIRIIVCTLRLLECYVKLMDCEKFLHFYHLLKNMPELQNHYREKIMVEIIYASGLIRQKRYEEAIHALSSLEMELTDSTDFLLLLDVLQKLQVIHQEYQTEKLETIDKKITYYKKLQKKRAVEFSPIFQKQNIQRWQLKQQAIHQYVNSLIQSSASFSYTLFHVVKEDYTKLENSITEQCKSMQYRVMQAYEEKLILIINQSEAPVGLIDDLHTAIPSLEHATLLSNEGSTAREFFDLTHAILYYKQFKKNIV